MDKRNSNTLRAMNSNGESKYEVLISYLFSYNWISNLDILAVNFVLFYLLEEYVG